MEKEVRKKKRKRKKEEEKKKERRKKRKEKEAQNTIRKLFLQPSRKKLGIRLRLRS